MAPYIYICYKGLDKSFKIWTKVSWCIPGHFTKTLNRKNLNPKPTDDCKRVSMKALNPKPLNPKPLNAKPFAIN